MNSKRTSKPSINLINAHQTSCEAFETLKSDFNGFTQGHMLVIEAPSELRY